MRIQVHLESKNSGPIILPLPCLHILQAFLYSVFSTEMADFLHSQGYESGGRRFKLFTFSWPEKAKGVGIKREQIAFRNPLSIVVASPVAGILQDLASGALTNQVLRIGNNEMRCAGVQMLSEPALTGEIKVRAVSPITCYSTMYRKDGSPYTVYHSPVEAEFKNQIHENLVKKFCLVNRDTPVPEGRVSIEPIGTPRQQIALFKKEDPRPIKGWWGNFRLKGPVEILRVGLDTGLGAKNSGGWGCVEILGGKEEHRC